MPITELLERNAREFGDEVALVELNPRLPEEKHMTWKEYPLIQSNAREPFRSELTWSDFDKKSNRLANLLLSRGIRKGDKVHINAGDIANSTLIVVSVDRTISATKKEMTLTLEKP